MNDQPTLTEAGRPLPLGPTWSEKGINFALFSRHGVAVTLIFHFLDSDHVQEIELDPEHNKTGDIWHLFLHTLGRPVYYGYRIKTDRSEGDFPIDTDRVIAVDPYCRAHKPRGWAVKSEAGSEPICLAARGLDFDWQGDRPLQTPASETIIYELHVRGFTRHPSSGVSAPGTFSAVVDKIDYLKELGITAVELLPVNEWDETDNKFFHPETGERLLNYWGYNPLSFFALRSGLAAAADQAVNEFKTMVRSLHQAGIEVILDLVFNHTGESDLEGTTSGFRAIDNEIYYLINKEQTDYLNYTGCGNTVNCNHPVVSSLIIDALHYLVKEFHIDGFRFDLAAIFSRDTTGAPIKHAPLIEMIAEDPLLRDCKIIAEAWDAAGLYQVGSFSTHQRWREWNGKYRDDVRLFMSGSRDSVHRLATRIAGSSDLYQSGNRGPLNSINFITCHDGFTLYDLVSYHDKRNLENGEQNRDGETHNLSWNSGFEGAPADIEIERIRQRRMKSSIALLLVSQGIPMLCAGDELGRSQGGNNNSWCQDNETSWIDWQIDETAASLLRFFKKCIGLRHRFALFRRDEFFPDQDGSAPPENSQITWQSLRPGTQDWSSDCHHLGILLNGECGHQSASPHFFVMVNGSRHDHQSFIVPQPPSQGEELCWARIIDTALESPDDFVEAAEADVVAPGSGCEVAPMGLVILQSIEKSAIPSSPRGDR
ncbi:MAG: glycogen-debranching protein [Desulfobulbaceae bacterium]|nr:MAG: glycogen-debranching protein [Desulfobulbaceae bacterium]